MTEIGIRNGTELLWDGKIGRAHVLPNQVVVVSFADGEHRPVPPSEFGSRCGAGEIQLLGERIEARVPPALTDIQRRQIEWMEAYLCALDRHESPHARGVREAVIREVGDRLGGPRPGRSTLSRWYRNWQKSGRDTMALVVDRAPRRRQRLAPEILALMDEVIREVYLQRSCPTKMTAYEAFEARFGQRAYKTSCPSYKAFSNRINSWDPLEVTRARQGPSAAREAARTSLTVIDPDYPLQRVEVDTAHFNIGLLDTSRQYYVGKAAIYLVIDVYSRAILGFAIDIGKPSESAENAIHALRYAVSMKSDHAEYPMHGLLRTVVFDSGPGYANAHTERFLSAIANDFQRAPSRMGWAKPFVERFIRTMRTRLFQNLRGYLGKYDPKAYSDDSLAGSAHYTFAELHQLVYEFIVHEYHHTPHESLNGKTPFDVWAEGVRRVPPVAPADMRSLHLLRCHSKFCKPNSVTGVHVNYQKFHSPELAALLRRLAAEGDPDRKLEVLWDPLDAGAVSVVDPSTGEIVEARNRRASCSGRSFADVNAARNGIRLQNDAPLLNSNPVSRERRQARRRRGPSAPIAQPHDAPSLESLMSGHAQALPPGRDNEVSEPYTITITPRPDGTDDEDGATYDVE